MRDYAYDDHYGRESGCVSRMVCSMDLRWFVVSRSDDDDALSRIDVKTGEKYGENR